MTNPTGPAAPAPSSRSSSSSSSSSASASSSSSSSSSSASPSSLSSPSSLPADVPPSPVAAGVDLDWRVVLRGALAGLAIIVPVTVLRVVLDREIADFDDSGWIYPLFVLILFGYASAGWIAGRARPDAPLTHGSLAGLGVLVLWIPIRIVIWAVREDGRGLVSGDRAALRPGQVFGALVIAATLAMLGALLAARLTRRRAA